MHTGAFHLQQQQQHQVQISVTSTDATYTAHVLNTIDEETTEEDKSAAFAIDEKDYKSDSECEVTVTVTLPTKKVEMNTVEEQTSNSPVDFWQQINDDGDEPALKERTDTAETSDGELSEAEGSSESSASSESVLYYEDEVDVDAFAKCLSSTSSDDDSESSEATDVDASEKSSPSMSSDKSEPSKDVAVCDVSDKSSPTTSDVTTSDADETSSDSGDSSEENATPSPQSDSSHKSSKNQVVTTVRPSTPPSNAVYLLDVVIGERDGGRRKSEEDADSGITTWSADISRQISEKDVQNVGGGVIETAAKKYQRTGTHSRLFDFLQRDDYGGGAAAGGPNKPLQLSATADLPSSCTSGYSSAATTPTTPSVSGGIRGRYESDTARAEYDSYYNSWEYACPYFGYDILPSKAFKTIAQQQQQGQRPVSTKFKCPKIPTGQNKS